MEEKKRKEKGRKNEIQDAGITLVALVITIVIIIILATVTINMAFGDNGLIKQAELAKDMVANSTVAEQEGMNSLMDEYANLLAEDSEITPPDTRSEIEIARDEGTVFETTTDLTDNSGNTVWIPGEFEIASDSATDVDDGIVITNQENTKQFVWIPVDSTILGEMYNTEGGEKTLNGVTTQTSAFSKLRVRSSDTSDFPLGQTTGIREPDVLSSYDTDLSYTNILGYANAQAMADAMVAEYNATYASIQKYGGFYIGRYELTGSVDIPTVERGGTVITSQNWYNLKKACTNLVSSSYAQSTMIYGNQWDEVMDWLKKTEFAGDEEKVDTDSSSWGNYNSGNSAKAAGYSETWKANNIYDLAGNCWEWVQEASGTDTRVLRGR